MATHCRLASSSEEPNTLGQELDRVGTPMAMPDRASKPTARYNLPAEDPNTSLVHDDMNTAFMELSQTMNTILKHSCKSLQGCATIHDMKAIVQVASLSYKTCCNMDLPTREESRTPFDSNSCCSPMQLTPSTHNVPSGSHPMPNGQWDSGRVGGCEGPLQILPSPSMHMLPLGSSLMSNGEWGSGKEGGGEEMYLPPSPNSNEKDDDNDENAGGKHSSTCLLDTLTTHHGSTRPMPMKHPTNKWGYLKPTSNESPALGHAINCMEPSLTSDKEAATTAGLLKSEMHAIATILLQVNLKHHKVCPSN
jgi:hypothetical protein